MTEYEQGFIDGVKSKVSAELAPTIEQLARDLTSTMRNAVDYTIRNVKITCKEHGEGHWIEHPDDLFPLESTIECSVCGEQENMDIRNDNFCPNCGAKMRGDENG